VNVNTLEKALRAGVAYQHAAISRDLLERIQQGLLASPFTPAKIKQAFAIARQKHLT
jgi:hypothetical protein